VLRNPFCGAFDPLFFDVPPDEFLTSLRSNKSTLQWAGPISRNFLPLPLRRVRRWIPSPPRYMQNIFVSLFFDTPPPSQPGLLRFFDRILCSPPFSCCRKVPLFPPTTPAFSDPYILAKLRRFREFFSRDFRFPISRVLLPVTRRFTVLFCAGVAESIDPDLVFLKKPYVFV